MWRSRLPRVHHPARNALFELGGNISHLSTRRRCRVAKQIHPSTSHQQSRALYVCCRISYFSWQRVHETRHQTRVHLVSGASDSLSHHLIFIVSCTAQHIRLISAASFYFFSSPNFVKNFRRHKPLVMPCSSPVWDVFQPGQKGTNFRDISLANGQIIKESNRYSGRKARMRRKIGKKKKYSRKVKYYWDAWPSAILKQMHWRFGWTDRVTSTN